MENKSHQTNFLLQVIYFAKEPSRQIALLVYLELSKYSHNILKIVPQTFSVCSQIS